jgi:glycosidase
MDIGPGGKFTSRKWTLKDLKAIVGKWQTSMFDAGGWNALFIENHDQPRSVTRWACDEPEFRVAAAKMLATFVGLQSGTPYIYQGQELGMANSPMDWGRREYKDIETQNMWTRYVPILSLLILAEAERCQRPGTIWG